MLFQDSEEQSEKADAVVENKNKQVFLLSLILLLTFFYLLLNKALFGIETSTTFIQHVQSHGLEQLFQSISFHSHFLLINYTPIHSIQFLFNQF